MLLSYGSPPGVRRGDLLRVGVLCTTSDSTNGNQRPRRIIQKSGFIRGNPEISSRWSTEENPGQDFVAKKVSESPSAKVRGNKLGFGNYGDDPYRILEDGRKVYLDEFDVLTLLDPPRFLRPLEPIPYNHAAFLWKKIGGIPEERRHRLLDILQPRHITKMWELSGLRYDDPDLFLEDAAGVLPRFDEHKSGKPMVWDGRVSHVPWYLKPFSRFQKVFFIGVDRKVYGRVSTGGKYLGALSSKVSPLYFQVKQADSVMATEEPCDLGLDYGNGHLHLCNSIPKGYPNPVKHLPPFNDRACDYLRAVGPGVMVGQTWIEGRHLEQIPYQLFGEFVLVQQFH